jgi:hypothetical protein
MADDELIGWEQAITTIMKRTGKTRRQATAALIKVCHEGKLPAFHVIDGKRVDIPKACFPLLPDKAVKQFDEDKSKLFLPLADFQRPGGMSNDELLGELRSGRLKASAVKLSKAHPEAPMVDLQSTAEWMANPQTPAHLVAKFKNSIDRKPH